MPNWIRSTAMPPRATDSLLGDTSATGRCWARQESGDLIGTCGQRRFIRYELPAHENHDGFNALGLMPAGRVPPSSGTDPEELSRPALPWISLQTALGSLPSVALSSAQALAGYIDRNATGKPVANNITSE